MLFCPYITVCTVQCILWMEKYILESSKKDICLTEGEVCILHFYNIGKYQEDLRKQIKKKKIMFYVFFCYTEENIIFTKKNCRILATAQWWVRFRISWVVSFNSDNGPRMRTKQHSEGINSIRKTYIKHWCGGTKFYNAEVIIVLYDNK